MMITNNNAIPAPIYRAVLNTKYSGEGEDCFCSVTGLLKGVKELILEQRHRHEIVEEASDRIWSLMGSAIHSVIEKSQTTDTLAEQRLKAVIDGKTITGGVDLYEYGTVFDFKFTSIWSYIYGSRLAEWTRQLNVYAYLYRKAGYIVNNIKIIAIYRDWQKSKFKFRKT